MSDDRRISVSPLLRWNLTFALLLFFFSCHSLFDSKVVLVVAAIERREETKQSETRALDGITDMHEAPRGPPPPTPPPPAAAVEGRGGGAKKRRGMEKRRHLFGPDSPPTAVHNSPIAKLQHTITVDVQPVSPPLSFETKKKRKRHHQSQQPKGGRAGNVKGNNAVGGRKRKSSSRIDSTYVRYDVTRGEAAGKPVIRPPVSPVYGDVRFVCPSGFNLVKKRCVRTMTTKPALSCPYGGYQNAAHQCVSVDSVAPERACPPGFKNYEHGCVRRLLSSPVPTCPSSYALNPSNPSDCISTLSSPPLKICTAETPVNLKDASYSQYNKLPKSARYLQSLSHSLLHSASHITSTSASPSRQRPVLGDDHPLALSSAPKLRSVAKPVLRSDGQCEVQRYSAAETVCPAGYTLSKDQKNCFLTVRNEPIYGCPEGYIMSEQKVKVCEKLVEIEAQMSCQGDDFHLESNQCVKRRRSKKTLRCPKGFVLSKRSQVPNSASLSSSKNSNSKTILKPQLPFVPKNESNRADDDDDNNDDDDNDDAVVCYQVSVQTGSVPHCREGWRYNPETMKCTYTLEEDPVFSCSNILHDDMALLHSKGHRNDYESDRKGSLSSSSSSSSSSRRLEDKTNSYRDNLDEFSNKHFEDFFVEKDDMCVSVKKVRPIPMCGEDPKELIKNNSSFSFTEERPIIKMISKQNDYDYDYVHVHDDDGSSSSSNRNSSSAGEVWNAFQFEVQSPSTRKLGVFESGSKAAAVAGVVGVINNRRKTDRVQTHPMKTPSNEGETWREVGVEEEEDCIETTFGDVTYKLNCTDESLGEIVSQTGVPACLERLTAKAVVVGCQAAAIADDDDNNNNHNNHNSKRTEEKEKEKEKEEQEQEEEEAEDTQYGDPYWEYGQNEGQIEHEGISDSHKAQQNIVSSRNGTKGALQTNTSRTSTDRGRRRRLQATSSEELLHYSLKIHQNDTMKNYRLPIREEFQIPKEDVDRCTEIRVSEISSVCPSGIPYRIGSLTCKQILTYPPELQCPAGMYLHLQTPRHQQHKPSGVRFVPTTKAIIESSPSLKSAAAVATEEAQLRRRNNTTPSTSKHNNNDDDDGSSSTTTTTTPPPQSSTSTSTTDTPNNNNIPLPSQNQPLLISPPTCLSQKHFSSTWTCPEGFKPVDAGKGKFGHQSSSTTYKRSPQLTIMPELFKTVTFQQRIRTFDKTLKSRTGGGAQKSRSVGKMCERVEFSTVQVVCPVGYRMDSEVKVKQPGKGCLAEKIVPPTPLCQPGYFMQQHLCVKHIEVSPSLVTLQGDTIPCSSRSHHYDSTSCGGLSSVYYSELKPTKMKSKKEKLSN